MLYPTEAALAWRRDQQRLERERENDARAALRRHLYRTDPLWRLSKLKDNRERILRRKAKEQRNDEGSSSTAD